MNTRIAILSGLLIAALSSGMAHAAGVTASAEPVPMDTSTNFLNGGIGTEEADAIRLKAASFPLRITFSQGKDGKSIAGATISIIDSKGKSVFELQDAGPILYVKLPNGNYKLNAEYLGVAQTKKISLAGKKGTNVYLNWKGSPDDIVTDSSKDEPSAGMPAAE